MEKAIQDLIREHDSILRILNVLEKICSSLKSRGKTDFHDIEQIIYFIRVFADKCHSGKEEELLFPALEEAGIKKENSINEIILEHELSRQIVLRMLKTISCNTIETDRFVQASKSYIDLLRDHIRKENTILFPMADSILTEAKQNELMGNFEKFVDKIIGKVKHNQLHMMFESIEYKYSAVEK